MSHRIKGLQERGVLLRDAVQEDAQRREKQKGIQKRVTAVKAGDTEGFSEQSPMRPTDEQLEKINKFTRRSVGADDVVAFKTYSCNDMPDRDDDRFKTACVKGFLDLEGPFSSVGKSYMIGHDYSKSAVGRIFDVGTERHNGVQFLTNEVYIPNTDANKEFIDNIDFGINWAVSVGVMLGADECSVCKSPFSSWGYWCTEGHDKGAWYDPNSDEKDSWGYPVPVEPNSKNAVKCLREFESPKDFYELSQVFLGAQYDAEIAKGIQKSASALKVPILGLSSEEAKQISVVHEPEAVTKARALYNVKSNEDGLLKWTDEDRLVWTFDPNDENGAIMALGKSAENQEEEDAGNSDGSVEEEHSDEERESPEGDAGGSESEGGEENLSEAGGEDLGGEGSVSDDDEENEEDEMDKSAVLRIAGTAKLPTSVIEKAAAADDNGLVALLAAASEEIQAKTALAEKNAAKAVLGENYIKSLRADAIDWYVKAHATSDADKGVSTENLEKMLDAFGDNTDLIKTLTEENKTLAQAKFPQSVRRSSFPTDPNERGNDSPSEKVAEDTTTKFATNRHR